MKELRFTQHVTQPTDAHLLVCGDQRVADVVGWDLVSCLAPHVADCHEALQVRRWWSVGDV